MLASMIVFAPATPVPPPVLTTFAADVTLPCASTVILTVFPVPPYLPAVTPVIVLQT